jgi:uncharacterized protein (DUF1810 family)
MEIFNFLKKQKVTNNRMTVGNNELENEFVENEPKKASNDKQHFVYNLIILDESGSMSSIQRIIISGFNELVQSIKGAAKQYSEQEHFISFISFNSSNIKTLHDCVPVGALEEIDATRYKPNNCTPLYDAIGFGIKQLQKNLDSIQNYNVLVTIMTDGLENASKEYSLEHIKALIEKLKKEGWTFTYIGTDHDIESVADSLAISNRMKFEKNEDDMREMFEKERYARHEYHRNIDRNEEFFKESYYGEERGFSRFLRPHKEYFDIALNEIKNGRKVSHWMWFMFPQIHGLGYSDYSKLYAIRDLDEARLFSIEYPTGEHLRMLCGELLKLPETDVEVIFGYIDAKKLRSSMTLFSLTPNANPIFQNVLNKFFNGQKDERTIEIIDNKQNKNN